MSAWQSAAIVRIAQQTPRMRSYFLQAPLARHTAGQYLDIKLTAPDGYSAQRSYSIASAPGAEHFELAVEVLEDGEVSPWFHEVALPGDTIEVRGPQGGHFVWSPDGTAPLLLMGGGSGVVPLMSIIRAWRDAGTRTPLMLFYSARHWHELAWRDELLELAESEPRFTLAVTATRSASPRPQDYTRRLDAAMLQELLQRWPHAAPQCYLCGANGFVETAAQLLLAAGTPAQAIRTERYGGS
ncbi:ferredoxin reductase [Pseudoduganella rhizocola]|uniref:ferredoxin reductase n=1 Tax=Pseudoduganella rhizocola TaxID=3382643 RepID=UPI0038B6A8EA